MDTKEYHLYSKYWTESPKETIPAESPAEHPDIFLVKKSVTLLTFIELDKKKK